MPEDFGKFVTSARTAYAAGKLAVYTGKLTLRGYAPALLDGLAAALGELTEPDLGADAPPPAAAAPTASDPANEAGDLSENEALRKAYDALRAWMKECKAVCRTVFRTRAKVLRDLHL